ncbi:MAG: ABC transporter ATP-binding protein [Anaerolineae bacterium]|nr:ABC transporter ATP-binding protein [Anaerolineae bacterium]MCB9107499.1 ABC transporter ATP-binding protein [Anaerolineales bacterium]
MAPAILFNQVSKCYRVGRGLASLFAIFGKQDYSETDKFHWAVNDVSFEVQPGEALAIIGPNGAGKTTTLKLLSRVTQPTSGQIQVNGRFSALIELGAGFHPELTGRENVYLNGIILGMKRSEIRARFDQIVDFAGIEQYLDTPVKRYSSGMYARLGFAIAAHVDPDVLLVDEVLAVGDYAFRMKCYNRMDELRAKGTSLLFVSHNMEDVRRVCDRGIVLYGGRKVFEGIAAEAVAEYANALRDNASSSRKSRKVGENLLAQKVMTHAARIERVEMIGADGIPIRTVRSGETVHVEVEVQFFEDAEAPVFASAFYGPNGEVVYDTTTRLLGVSTPNFRAGDRAVIRYELTMNLIDGLYRLTTDLAYNDLSCYYDYVADALSFVVVASDPAKGIANLQTDVSFEMIESQAVREPI